MNVPASDVALIALAALFVAILVSCFSRINVGFIAMTFAWLIGVYLAD